MNQQFWQNGAKIPTGLWATLGNGITLFLYAFGGNAFWWYSVPALDGGTAAAVLLMLNGTYAYRRKTEADREVALASVPATAAAKRR